MGFNSFQTFLLGIPAYAFDASGVSNHRFLLNDSAAYVQDDYKVTRNLTANLGLRWDLMSAPQDALHHMANVIPGLLAQGESPFVYPKSVDALNIPGLVGTTSETGRTNNYASNWGPRIGFAYDVLGKHTMSIRSGYAIYYERENMGVAEQLASQAPFAPSVTTFGTTPDQLATMFNGLLPAAGTIDPSYVPQPSHLVGFIDPTTGLPTSNPNMYPIFSGSTYSETAMSVPLHYVSPSTQQWNLSVQRSLPKSWIMEVGYVGSKGTHLSAMLDPMQALLASPQNPITVQDVYGNSYTITQNTQLNVGARSPQLGLNPRGYFQFVNSATSHYNSLQATLAHQFARGLHFQGAYTLSKSTDPVASVGAGVYQFPMNDQTTLAPSMGLSDFDRTHRLVLSYRYEIPFFSHAHGLQSAVLGTLVGRRRDRFSVRTAFPCDRLPGSVCLWHTHPKHSHSEPCSRIHPFQRADHRDHRATPYGIFESCGLRSGPGRRNRRLNGLRHCGPQRFPRTISAELGHVPREVLDLDGISSSEVFRRLLQRVESSRVRQAIDHRHRESIVWADHQHSWNA